MTDPFDPANQPHSHETFGFPEKSSYYPEPKLLDGKLDFEEDYANNRLLKKTTQEIPDDWMAANRKQREDSLSRREGEFMPVASIPVEVVQWMHDVLGYDVFNEPFRKTIALLKQHGLDNFILTNKQL